MEGKIMSKYQINPILQLMNSDITLHINRLLAHAIGMNETIIYSTLISKFTYYSIKEMIDDDGWFYSTVPDIQESTTFSERTQRRAINNLIEYGLIESKLQGMPAKRYFRILNDIELLESLIAKGDEIAKSIKLIADEKNTEKILKRNEKKQEISSENENSQFLQNAGTSSDETQEQVPTKCRNKFQQNAGTSSCEVQDKSKSNKSKSNKSESNQSVCHRVETTDEKNSAENDRPTDRLPQKTFSEILDDINYYSTYAVNENDEPDAEAVMKCSLPYAYKENKKAMKKAIAFLFGFNFYSQGMEEQDKNLFSQVIALITELTTYDKSKVGKYYVKYYEVIDKLNELIKHNMLYDWFLSFIPEWTSICQERKIKNVRAYLKSCIWSWLNEYDFVENYQINGIIKSDYQPDSSKINENTPKIDFQSASNEIIPQKEARHHEPVKSLKSDVVKSDKKAVPSQSELNGNLRCNSESSVISSDTPKKADTEPVRDYEIDYVLKDGKTEEDIQKIFISKDLSLDEKVEWLDKFVENWRNSETSFCLSSIKHELYSDKEKNKELEDEELEDEFMLRRKHEILAQLKQVNI